MTAAVSHATCDRVTGNEVYD